MKRINQNSTITRVAITLLLLSLSISCKEKTTYQMQILIKNETNSILTIKLYPKSAYMSGEHYDFSAIGGGYQKTESQLEIDTELLLYISGDINQKPDAVASQVFDSIHVISADESKAELKFSPGTVIGYSDNLYDDDSEWNYELRKFDLQTNFQKNPVESHDYTFVISEDKYGL
jgi:hypothetical protein